MGSGKWEVQDLIRVGTYLDDEIVGGEEEDKRMYRDPNDLLISFAYCTAVMRTQVHTLVI